MKVSEFLSCMGDSAKALVKMVLQSRRTISPRPCAKGGDSIIILGNGPSLKDTLSRHSAEICRRPVLAVNFMANAPQFREIRPDYYVLADPHFFTGAGNANCRLSVARDCVGQLAYDFVGAGVEARGYATVAWQLRQ